MPERLPRRRLLQTSVSAAGLSLPGFLQLREQAATASGTISPNAPAKRCIVLYCWGGMSHHETWDLKTDAPKEVRGEFNPISTATPGILLGEHIPHLAKQTDRLAIVRSVHHLSSAHGMGMYWNMTGHPHVGPAVVRNESPTRKNWPSLGAMMTAFNPGGEGVPGAMRLPYPLVDNGTLQAGEYGGWLGVKYDPIVVRTPGGKPFGGVSRDLGSPVLNLADGVQRDRLNARRRLLGGVEEVRASTARTSSKPSPSESGFDFFRELALDMLLSPKVKAAFDLDSEQDSIKSGYGNHICGRSILLARRLTEAGVPLVTVCCAAGDLNGSRGDHWDTHGNNFRRLKNTMLPTFDKPSAFLLEDLAQRGQLDETLVVFLTEFGRTPKINRGAGRDHYPSVYSVAFAGGGIKGGQVYGSSDKHGAFPHDLPCGPNDLHATIFQQMGVPLDALLYDRARRPYPITDGMPLPLT